MAWGEAVRLTTILANDPSSMVGAALAGWQRPASWEWLALKSIHDRFVQSKFKKPYPFMAAPWDKPPTRHGSTVLSRGELRALLDAHRQLPARKDRGQVVA